MAVGAMSTEVGVAVTSSGVRLARTVGEPARLAAAMPAVGSVTVVVAMVIGPQPQPARSKFLPIASRMCITCVYASSIRRQRAVY